MADKFKNKRMDIDAPLIGALGAVTPSDTVDLTQVTREILITGAGNVAVVWFDGAETVEPVLANTRYKWSIRRVKATSTTATGIRAYY